MSNPIFNLEQYVAQQNAWNAIFGSPAYDLTSAKDRQKLAERIDSELSPENLTCDGELPAHQVQVKYKRLVAAAEELKQLDPTVTFWEV